MILKPSTCDGCPFKSRGKWFVPDEMVEGASVVVLSQNPGADEEEGRRLTHYDGKHKVYTPCTPSPLIGTTGYDLSRKYLPLAGLERGKSVSLANPIRCRLDNTNELPPVTDKVLRQAVEHCQHHYYRPPASTRRVVAEGAVALYAATGEDGTEPPGHKISRGIEGWRGWLLPWNPPPRPRQTWTTVWQPSSTQVSVLSTFHLSYLYRAPWYTPVSQRDWSKVPSVLAGTWPKPFPEIIPTTPNPWPEKYAFDTEYFDRTLIRYSLAYRGRFGQPFLYVVESAAHTPVYLAKNETHTAIFHNVEADLDYLASLLSPNTVTLKMEDTMYLHAVLWADLDHDLDFVGSIYSWHNRTKHLLRSNPRVYAGGDALMTWDAHVPMQGELERDPRVKKVYYDYQLPLAPIIHRARAAGLRVVPERVEQALQSMGVAQEESERMAQAHCGWPINVGSSSQVSRELFEIERVQINPISGKMRR